MTEREKMSPVDTAWLRMDHPGNLMMIVGVFTFADVMDFARLRMAIEQKLLSRYPRFRQRVYQEASNAWWEEDPEFNLDNHLVRCALPAPAGKKELQRLASELAAEPLHPASPRWRFDFVENYQGGTALVMRFHHCIADGIGLVSVLLSMTDEAADAPPRELPAPAKPSKTERRLATLPWLEPMAQASLTALNFSSRFWNGYFKFWQEPERAIKLGKDGVGFVGELVKLLSMPNDSPTRLKGRTGGRKRVAWCEPIQMGEVKAVDKALGCSVNDILLSSVAGALRSYLLARGDSVAGVEIRVLVPVNLRTEKDEGTLGNHFGMVTLLLPLHEGNPFKRLLEVRRRMQEMKHSYQPLLTLMLLGAAGVAPKMVQEKFLDSLANKASAVITNVPGPRKPLYLAGSRAEQIMFWVPQSGDIGIGASILSYNEKVQFGLIADQRFIPDPDTVTDLFQHEFERMVVALMLHGWEQPLDPDALEQTLMREIAQEEFSESPTAPVTPKAEAATQPDAQHDRPTAPRVPKRFRNL